MLKVVNEFELKVLYRSENIVGIGRRIMALVSYLI